MAANSSQAFLRTRAWKIPYKKMIHFSSHTMEDIGAGLFIMSHVDSLNKVRGKTFEPGVSWTMSGEIVSQIPTSLSGSEYRQTGCLPTSKVTSVGGQLSCKSKCLAHLPTQWLELWTGVPSTSQIVSLRVPCTDTGSEWGLAYQYERQFWVVRESKPNRHVIHLWTILNWSMR